MLARARLPAAPQFISGMPRGKESPPAVLVLLEDRSVAVWHVAITPKPAAGGRAPSLLCRLDRHETASLATLRPPLRHVRAVLPGPPVIDGRVRRTRAGWPPPPLSL